MDKARPKTWFKVKAPIKWRPTVGELVEGEYTGSAEREGQYGKYTIYFIKMKGGKIHFVSGSVVTNLFTLVPIGMLVRLVYLGKKQAVNTGRNYHDYELFTEEAIELRAVGG